MSSNDMSQFLSSKIRKYGKVARKLMTKKTAFSESQISNHESASTIIEKNEIDKWKFVSECNDSKEVWRSINMKGEVKADVSNDVSVDELAS